MIPMLRTLCDPGIIHAQISLVLSHILRGNFQSDVSWYWTLVLSQSRSAPNTRNETDSDPSRGLGQRMRLSSRHKALSGILFVGFSGSFVREADLRGQH